MIEAAEYVLRDLGFYDVRVRHHELRIADCGLPIENGTGAAALAVKSAIRNLQSEIVRHLARIEVGASELPKLLENGLSARVTAALKQIGYAHVKVDLQGYRRGGADERKAAGDTLKVAG